jgi:hypothetical protein
MAETALDVLDRIKKNRSEQAFCYAQLEMWAKVKAQGIDIDTVATFSYSEKHHTSADKKELQTAWRQTQSNPFVRRMPNGSYRVLFFNFVRHHDGSITVLNPKIKAPYADDF